MAATDPTPTPARAHPARSHPDARPMRLVIGAGGLAAFSALAAAIVLPPTPAPSATADTQQANVAPTGTPIDVQRPIQYVQLQPGQTAPPGATVIDPAAPTPMTIVVTITAPPAPAQKSRVIRTTQSGKVLP